MDATLRDLCRRLDDVVAAAAAVVNTIDDPEAGPAAAEMQKGQLNLPWHAGCRAALEHLRTHPDVAKLRLELQELARLTQPALTSIDQQPPRAQPHPWTRLAGGNGNGHQQQEA